jgi:hypothetical protein
LPARAVALLLAPLPANKFCTGIPLDLGQLLLNFFHAITTAFTGNPLKIKNKNINKQQDKTIFRRTDMGIPDFLT